MGTWRQGLKQKLWKSAADRLASPSLLSYFACVAQVCRPRGSTTTHRGLDSLTSICNQENALWTCSQVNLMEAFLS